MDDYRNDVERFAKERSGEPFYNSSIDHATVIVEKMFKHAKSEVCVITTRMNGRVFGQDEVVDEVEGFLSDSGHKLRILMEDDLSAVSEGHGFLRAIKRHPNECEVRKLPERLRDGIEYHFLLADNDSYRFEPNKKEWVAVAAFGDKVGAERLKGVFDALWMASDDMDITATH